jgi:hypothetical protein
MAPANCRSILHDGGIGFAEYGQGRRRLAQVCSNRRNRRGVRLGMARGGVRRSAAGRLAGRVLASLCALAAPATTTTPTGVRTIR